MAAQNSIEGVTVCESDFSYFASAQFDSMMEDPRKSAAPTVSTSARTSRKSRKSQKLFVDSFTMIPKSLYMRLDREAELRKLTGAHNLVRARTGEEVLVCPFTVDVEDTSPLMYDDEGWESDGSYTSDESESSCSSIEEYMYTTEPEPLEAGSPLKFIEKSPVRTNGQRATAHDTIGKKRKSLAMRLLGRANDINKGGEDARKNRKSFFARLKSHVSGKKSIN